MGQQGADVQLSSAAQKLFPFAVECKSRKKQSVQRDYEQAVDHAKNTALCPIVFLKENSEHPLVVLDAEIFLNLQLRSHETRTNT